MNMYLVEYWYPYSEYGGLQCVIAENADHCVEILAIRVDRSDRQSYPDYEKRIKQCVDDAKVFKLQDDYAPGVVDSFIT